MGSAAVDVASPALQAFLQQDVLILATMLQAAQQQELVAEALAMSRTLPAASLDQLLLDARQLLLRLPEGAAPLAIAHCMMRRGRGGPDAKPVPTSNATAAKRQSAALSKLRAKLLKLATQIWESSSYQHALHIPGLTSAGSTSSSFSSSQSPVTAAGLAPHTLAAHSDGTDAPASALRLNASLQASASEPGDAARAPPRPRPNRCRSQGNMLQQHQQHLAAQQLYNPAAWAQMGGMGPPPWAIQQHQQQMLLLLRNAPSPFANIPPGVGVGEGPTAAHQAVGLGSTTAQLPPALTHLTDAAGAQQAAVAAAAAAAAAGVRARGLHVAPSLAQGFMLHPREQQQQQRSFSGLQHAFSDPLPSTAGAGLQTPVASAPLAADETSASASGAVECDDDAFHLFLRDFLGG